MRRAALAGVATIEHGNEGTPEIFKLMAEHQVAWCPTLTAGAGPWPPAGGLDSPAVARKRDGAQNGRIDAGVTIIAGSDVGTFPHGDNARELDAMVALGMSPAAALKSATVDRRRRCCAWTRRSAQVKAGTVRGPRGVRRAIRRKTSPRSSASGS